MKDEFLKVDIFEGNDENLSNRYYEDQALNLEINNVKNLFYKKCNRKKRLETKELNDWYNKISTMVYTTSEGYFIKFKDERCFFNGDSAEGNNTFEPIGNFYYIPANYNIEKLTLEELKTINNKTRYYTEIGGRLIFITMKKESQLKLIALNENISTSDIVLEIDKVKPAIQN